MAKQIAATPKSYWASNIRFLRMRKNITQEVLASELGFTVSKVKAHEAAQTRNPVVEDLIMISEYFKMSVDTLLKINLTKISERSIRELEQGNDVFTSGTHLRILATTVDKNNKEQVEFVSKKARAGYLEGFTDPEFISSLPAFSMPHLPTNRKFRMFPISGDSMLPIPDGALIIGSYVEDWSSIKKDTPCIVITQNDGIVFKMLTPLFPAKKSFQFASLNISYKPYELPVSEMLEVWQFVNYISDKMPLPENSDDYLVRVTEEIKFGVEELLQRKA